MVASKVVVEPVVAAESEAVGPWSGLTAQTGDRRPR